MDGQRNTHIMGHLADPVHYYISYFTDQFAVHNILPYYFGTGEDEE
jgi:hypothetical protein